MARLDRKHQKVFAGQAADNGVFGSLMAEDPTISNDIEELQSLEAWEKGWNQATMTSADLPPLEEIQGLEYVLSRQQAYIFQEGLAEWNEDTVYYKGSIVKVINGDNFVIYGSLANDNSNAVTDTSSWKVLYDSTKTYVDTVLGDSRYVTVNTAQTVSGAKTFTGTVTAATINGNGDDLIIGGTGSDIALTGSSTTAVTPVSDSDSTDIATTAWTNDKLDTKQETLSTAQLAAVNSGITSEKVTTYDGYAETIATKADDSEVVHLAGEETITGIKTFTQHVNITKTPSAVADGLYITASAANSVYTALEHERTTSGNYLSSLHCRANAGDAYVNIVYQADADKYAFTMAGISTASAVTPDASSDSEAIATTEWVNDKLDTYMQMTNGIYDGVDLTSKFASEIGSNDVWTWLHNRIAAGNFTGLHVGDYIPVTISAGTVGSDSVAAQTFNCQIAGIDTYYRYGDSEIGHHIDFISKECCATEVKWNDSNCNNGTSSTTSPWLASKVYGWLNGVNNAGTAYSGNAVGIDAEGKGLYQLLPSTLRARIIQKRQLLDTRYSSSALIDYSTGWGWYDMGCLWLPNEIEVYGTQIRSNVTQQDGWWNPEANIGQTYPLWSVCQKARVKWLATGTSSSRTTWWLCSAADNSAVAACLVNSYGDASSSTTTETGCRVPLCFRIG